MPDESVQLGDLRLIRKIAAGGMAEVWEARKTGVEGFEKRIAVKIILPHLTENEEFTRMFLDEGRLVARLDHPNICQISELGEVKGTYYMGMEYIDGLVLSALMKEAAKRGQFIPFEHCCQIIIGACAGLDYAHSCKDLNGAQLNLVHRDISPQNIMLTYDGGIKVLDFGIAKAATQIHHTRVGVVKGKYAYMSPEQAMGKPLDHRSDIFALGVVLWELTTGHRLFRADNEIATLHKIIGGDYPAPTSFRDSYPPALELIVQKALSIDVDGRFQDCGDMQLALEEFLLRHGLAAGSKRLAHYVRRLTSNEDMPDLPEAGSLLHSVFEGSNPVIHTPSPAQSSSIAPPLPTNAYGDVPSKPVVTPVSGAMKQVDFSSQAQAQAQAHFFQHGSMELGDEIISSARIQRYARSQSRFSLLLAIILVVLLGGAGAFAYIWFNKQPDVPISDIPWRIESTPSHAEIYVNGDLRGRTPSTVMFAVGNNYIINLRSEGYVAFIKEIQNFNKELSLKPLLVQLKEKPKQIVMGKVLVRVKPHNAEVLLNDKPLKALVAGVYSDTAAIGEAHTLIVRLKEYEEQRKVFNIDSKQSEIGLDIELQKLKSQQPRRIAKKDPSRKKTTKERDKTKVALHPNKKDDDLPIRYPERRDVRRNVAPDAWIAVNSTPPGAVIKLNGMVIGSTPLRNYKLSPGEHTIVVSKEGYHAETRRLQILADQTQRIDVGFRSLEPPKEPAIVSFGGQPSSRVYLNGKLLGPIPLFSQKTIAGKHLVEYQTIKYGARFRKHVTFKPGNQQFRHHFPTGHIWLLSRPVAKVYLNGDYLGDSMKPPYPVPAGTYKVRFLFPDGRSVTEKATVRPNQKERVVARLQD